MTDRPIYTSKSTVKSLWQEYRIYEDRVELDTHLGVLTVPVRAIERVDVRPSDVAGLLRGDLQLRDFRPALKLDWANFLEHVVIDKATGAIRRLKLTPDSPAAFKRALDGVLRRSRGPGRGA